MDESGSSNINPLALLFLLVMSLLVFTSRPKTAIRAVLATAAFVPLGQQINLGGLHLYFLRLLILAGLMRLFSRGELRGFRLIGVDKLIICWSVVGLVCGLIRDPSPEVVGRVYDDLGVYFIFRALMRDMDDCLNDLKLLAVVGVLIAMSMSVENLTNHNPFYFLGGVPDIPALRDGRFRCQGPFQHAILAGTFGATLIPLMVGLWQQGAQSRGRMVAIFGLLAGTIITVTSASSGPLMTYVAAGVGFGLWLIRKNMRWFRRGCVAFVLALGLMMKAPVWFVIARLSDFTGGGGYYRAQLIDRCINHFSEWWLIGTSFTANWAEGDNIVLETNAKMVDITNHYILQGINGGLLKLILFIAILTSCFKITGRYALDMDAPKQQRQLSWALGVCLACHCTAFISVAYFDQIQVFWFWLLAAIATLPVQAERRAEQEAEARAEDQIDSAGEPLASPVG